MKNPTPTPPSVTKKINTFWKWFAQNEKQIIKALISDYEEEVMTTLNQKLSNVSTRIGFFYELQNTNPIKLKLTISSKGYSKLFPKIDALVQQAPKLEMWNFQALVQPVTDTTKYQQETDAPYDYRGIILKISEMYFTLLELNTVQKKIKIKVYLNHYYLYKNDPHCYEAVEMCIMDITGEVFYRRHISSFELAQMPNSPKKMTPLHELLHTVETLRYINKRVKTVI